MDSSSGGVPRGVSNLAIQLNNQGLKSQIFSSGNTRKQIANNESLIKNLVRNGIDIDLSQTLIKNSYGLGSLRNIYQIISKFTSTDLVVLHQVYTFSTLLGYIYAKRHRVPYAIMPHGSLSKYHESDSRIIKKVAKKLIISKILKNASAIIVTCKSERDDLNIFLQSKAHIINYGATIGEKSVSLKPQLNIKSSAIRIMFSGRFDKKKNLPLLLKALPEILNSYHDLVLDVAGSGTTREVSNIKKIVTKLKISNNVKFHGWIDQNEMIKLFNSARLLVLPSSNENFAIVVSESLSMGVPCVISKFVGTSDIVAKHHAGEIINDLTPSAIAAEVIRVLNGDENVYRAAALKATREELDWAKIGTQWKRLIKDLAVECK